MASSQQINYSVSSQHRSNFLLIRNLLVINCFGISDCMVLKHFVGSPTRGLSMDNS